MRPTLYFEDQTVTPDEFEQRWRRSASALQAAGVRDGEVVDSIGRWALHHCRCS